MLKVFIKQIYKLLTSTFLFTLRDITLYLIICTATYLMLKMVIGYSSFDLQYEFLSEKQEYIHNKVWIVAFYTHVFFSIFTLLAGFTQFSNYLLYHHKKLHKTMGKVYVIAVLFINFPSGFILAIYASGLLPSKAAFLILDILWFGFTLKAYKGALHKNFKIHKQFMIRSYALTFSAITLRTWRIILSSVIIIPPINLYMIDAWMGFMPNLFFAEWLIRRKQY